MLIDELAKNMQMGKQTDLILLDFSKAFDKVSHEKTPPKTSPLWHQRRHSKMDFLDNQKQAVVINGINSEKIPVSSGVSQGSNPESDFSQTTLPYTSQSAQPQKARSYKQT